jgi:hypothetical protein
MRYSLVVGLALSLSTHVASAQNVTAFKTGEQTTGLTKQCYYSFGSSRYTETVQSYALCPLSIQVGNPTPKPPAVAPVVDPNRTPPASAVVPIPPMRPILATAFKTGERVTGATKQCSYSFGGSEYSKTVQAYELCPLSIAVKP